MSSRGRTLRQVGDTAGRKVLIVAYHYPPDAAIGAVRPAKFAKYLPEFGWEPIVYTLKERFCETCDYDRLELALSRVPTYRGTLIPGPLQVYSKIKGTTTTDKSGLNKMAGGGRAALQRTQSGSLKRFLGALSRIPDEDQGWIVNVAVQGLMIARKHGVHAVVTSGPPMSTHLGGLLLRKITGIRWVADFRDPWVTSPNEMVRPHTGLTRNMNRWLESVVVANADAVISTAEETTTYFKSILPHAQRSKCFTIFNGFDDDDFALVDSATIRKEEKVRITYAGSLYLNRDPEPLFSALRELVSSGQVDRDLLEIDLVGDCTSYRGVSVQGLIEDYGLANIVRILDKIPYKMCLARMANSNALLLFAQGQPDQIPGKVFDYLRINKPIYAIAEDGATRKVLEPFTNVFIANPDKHGEVVTEFLRMIEALKGGTETLDTASKIERYSRRELTRQFAEHLA